MSFFFVMLSQLLRVYHYNCHLLFVGRVLGRDKGIIFLYAKENRYKKTVTKMGKKADTFFFDYAQTLSFLTTMLNSSSF